jgi:RNA-directed DNA polymerase
MGKPAATDRPCLTSLSHSFTLDAVVHCRTREQAEEVMRSIALRLAECGLAMHPGKSKVVYCKDSNRTASYPHVHFTFLGFTFRPRKAINRQKRAFTNFLPGVSADALKRMRKEVRSWRIHRQTPGALDELAKQYNPKIQGWWNYFGAFYRSAMHKLFQYIDEKLMQWATRKYKTLLRHKTRSARWLSRVRRQAPQMFCHWSVVGNQVG